MVVQNYDPFAIQKYAFTLKKTNTYFTFITIIISQAIVALSIIMNLDVVSHLWLPRSELPTTLNTFQEYPIGPFSTTLLCYYIRNFTANTSYPGFKAFDQKQNPIYLRSVAQEEVLSAYPNLTAIIGSRFGCLDFAGVQYSYLQKEIFIQIEGGFRNIDYYLQQTTIQNILEQTQPSLTLIWEGGFPFKFVQFSSKFMTAQIQDSLYLNAEPAVINTFGDQIFFQAPVWTYPYNTTNQIIGFRKFRAQDLTFTYVFKYDGSSYDVLTSINITRYDIGYIVGAVLSWVSIFTLICGLIILPIMERSAALTQAECLFSLEAHLKNPSLFRFIVASCKSGIYPKEDIFVKLSEELEKRKEIATMLKATMTLQRINPFTSRGSDDIISCEENFNDPKDDRYFAVNHINNPFEPRKTAADFERESEQKQMGKIEKKVTSLLLWFDIGSDNISLFFARNGHGSKPSLCLTFIFGVGFLIFLSFFGVFKYHTSVQQYDFYSQENSYKLDYNQILLALNSNVTVPVQIMDGNYNIISNLTMQSHKNCSQNLQFRNIQLQTLWFFSDNLLMNYITCLPQDVTLVSSQNRSKERLLYFPNQETAFGNLLHTPRFQKIVLQAAEAIDPVPTQRASDAGALYYWDSKMKIFNEYSEGQLMSQKIYRKKMTQKSGNLVPFQLGFTITLDLPQQVSSSTTSTIFDLAQSIWGLSIVCFTVILRKLTKYINIAYKRERVTPRISQFRESVCILLAKMNEILSGKFKPQLQKSKYYLKESINAWESRPMMENE